MRYIFISICFVDYIFYAIFASEKEHKRYKLYEYTEKKSVKRDNADGMVFRSQKWLFNE